MEVKEPRSTEVKDAIKMAKDTTRNGLCPCGCGNKAKKCVNGRRVMEFKRLFLETPTLSSSLSGCFCLLLSSSSTTLERI